MQPQAETPGRSLCRKIQPPPLARQAGDERQRIGRGEAGVAQRLRQQRGFPGPVGGVAGMLQDAAAAAAEMGAWRGDAGLAWTDDGIGGGVPAIAARLQRARGDGFARQGEGNVQRRAVWQAGDAVGLEADALDPDIGLCGRLAGPGGMAGGHTALCIPNGAEAKCAAAGHVMGLD